MNESIYLRQRQPPRRCVFLLIFAVLALTFFSSRTVLSYLIATTIPAYVAVLYASYGPVDERELDDLKFLENRVAR